jgi:hypothetical protein
LAGETEELGENLPQCRFVQHKPHMLCPDANPGRRGGKPATNRLSYGTAIPTTLSRANLSTGNKYLLNSKVDSTTVIHSGNKLSFLSTVVLLDKLRAFQLAKKFHAYLGAEKFITVSIEVYHMSPF